MGARGRIRSWGKRAVQWAIRNQLLSINDPRLADWLTGGNGDFGPLTGEKAMALSAWYRGCEIVAGSIGGLPLRTLRDVTGVRTRVSSVFDDPGGVVGYDPFQWKKIQVLHIINHGDAFLRHIFNGLGALVGFEPIHPLCVTSKWSRSAPGGKLHTFTEVDENGVPHTVTLDARGITQVMGTTLDGLRGMSRLELARVSLGGALSADKAAGKMWHNGMMLSGIITPEEDLEDDDAKVARAEINAAFGGVENAGKVRLLNRKLTFNQLSMSSKDAQFLESRGFNIQEIARWLGVHPNLLMDPGAVSTWGTGVEIQNRSLGRFTLTNLTLPMQQAYTRALRGERFTEFDYAGLERGSPAEEIALLIDQYEAGLISKEEYRRIRNMDPLNPEETFVDSLDQAPQEIAGDPTNVLRVRSYVGRVRKAVTTGTGE